MTLNKRLILKSIICVLLLCTPVQAQAINRQIPTDSAITLSFTSNTMDFPTMVMTDQREAVLGAIAYCESRDRPDAKNPLSTASGRFQFIRSSWVRYGKELWGDDWVSKDVFDWNDNTELARYVYSKNGTADWKESEPCWTGKLRMV